MKQLLKKMLGFVKCTIYGIRNKGDIYIGNSVNIVNGKHISLGKNISIRPFSDLFALNYLIINDGCDIGTRNRIAGNVIIEKNVLIGPDNYICSYDHTYLDITLPIIAQAEHNPNKNGHTELQIGEGSWIGTHCAIIGDVHIGKHCVIGANSVVTKDIDDYSVAFGVPAKIIKKFSFDENKWISM